jgi:hypothetical protein
VKNSREGLSHLLVDYSRGLTLASPANELLLLDPPACGVGETFDCGSTSDVGCSFAVAISFRESSEFEAEVRLGLVDPFDIVDAYSSQQSEEEIRKSVWWCLYIYLLWRTWTARRGFS